MKLQRKDLAALVIAVVADSIQIGTTVITVGGDQFALPVQAAFSAVISLILVRLVGFDLRLLPGALLEFVPMANVAPAWTVAVIWTLMDRSPEDPDSLGL